MYASKNALCFSFFLSLLAFAPSCNQQSRSADAASYNADYAPMKMQAEASEEGAERVSEAPKLIVTAYMRCRVKDLEASARNVQTLAEAMKGRISEMNWSSTGSSIENRLVIRVPAAMLDSLMDRIAAEAQYVHYRNLQSQDVTEEFLDVETRLRTKKEVRDRYLDLLRNKAKTVTEVLDAEDKIRVLQEEIEVQEGRMRYLSDRVALSTLTLELYQPVLYEREPETVSNPFGRRLLQTVKDSFQFLQSLVLGIVYIWPIWVLFGLGFYFWRRRRNRRKKSNV